MLTLLQDDEWSKFSDRKIAEICCVDNSTVSQYRKQLLESNSSSDNEKRIGRDGKARKLPDKSNGSISQRKPAYRKD